MEEEGVTMIELDPKEREKFKEAVIPVWKKYSVSPRQREIIETITGVSF